MKRYAPFIIVLFIALITVGTAAMFYQSKRQALAAAPKKQIADQSEGGHVRGPAKAPVTLEEFGDFQCPPCGALAEPLRQIEKDYGAKLRVIFRHFPFAIHEHAQAAACAAEAAGSQGHFWEMHDLLYGEQGAWSKAPDAENLFESYASMLRLDIGRFNKDRQNEDTKARVGADQKHGADMGVKNTPTIFINGHQLPPASLSPDGLRKAIDDALAQTPAAH